MTPSTTIGVAWLDEKPAARGAGTFGPGGGGAGAAPVGRI